MGVRAHKCRHHMTCEDCVERNAHDLCIWCGGIGKCTALSPTLYMPTLSECGPLVNISFPPGMNIVPNYLPPWRYTNLIGCYYSTFLPYALSNPILITNTIHTLYVVLLLAMLWHWTGLVAIGLTDRMLNMLPYFRDWVEDMRCKLEHLVVALTSQPPDQMIDEECERCNIIGKHMVGEQICLDQEGRVCAKCSAIFRPVDINNENGMCAHCSPIHSFFSEPSPVSTSTHPEGSHEEPTRSLRSED